MTMTMNMTTANAKFNAELAAEIRRCLVGRELLGP
jgi:hypothetical protein